MPGAVEVTSLLPFDCVYATCRSEAPKGSRNGSGFSQLAPPTFREKGLRRKSGEHNPSKKPIENVALNQTRLGK